eukprot:symbB.v1.2.033509.t1/scaffold4173.1/size43543/5
MRCNVFSTLPTLPTLLAAFSPLDALGSWRQLCRSWRQGLQAEITLREVLSNLNFGALRLDLPKSCAACKAVAKYIPKNLHVLNLDFFRCHLGKAAIEYLASTIHPGLTQLQLRMTRSHLGTQGLQRLARQLPSSLRSLSLFVDNCSVGNDGIFAINLRALPNLQSFRFAAADDLKVDDAGLRSVAAGMDDKSLLRLLRLDFSRSLVSFRGIQYLSERLPGNLEVLQLSFSNCHVSPEGATSLADRLPGTLRELNLNLCRGEIGEYGAMSICKRLPASLRKLYLNWKDSGLRSMVPVTTLLNSIPSGVHVLRLDLTGVPMELLFPTHLTYLALTLSAIKGDKDYKKRLMQSFPSGLNVDLRLVPPAISRP